MKAWDTAEIVLTERQARAVATSRLVQSVSPAAVPGKWVVASDSRVGVAVGDGWELRVEPRLAVPRLMFLLAYASSKDGWRDVIAGFDPDDDRGASPDG